MSQADSSDRQFEQLAQEFAERYRQGQSSDIAEYIALYPEHAEEIRDLFPTLVLLERAMPEPDNLPDELVAQVTVDGRTTWELGDYRILRELGRGGMGVVYEAEHLPLGRRVALKVFRASLSDDVRSLQRFQHEARSGAALHHTHIVPVFEAREHEGVHFIAMQFIRGHDLEAVLNELRRFKSGDPQLGPDLPRPPDGHASETSPIHHNRTLRDLSTSEFSFDSDVVYFRSVARLGIQVADALAYAHAHGVLHRDIKPSNLMLDAEGMAWVTDFGLAKTDGEDLSHTGDLLGTLRYMAPERFSGHCDARSDVYGLGITLYESLTLQPAHAHSARAPLMQSVLEDKPANPRSVNPSIPSDLETIVLKAISKQPQDRYERIVELCDDLQRFLDGRPVRARRISPAGVLYRWSRRRPVVAALSLALVTCLIFGVTAVWVQWRRAEGNLAQARLHATESQRQEEIAEQERQRAQDNLMTAHGILQHYTLALDEALHRIPHSQTRRRESLRKALAYYRAFLEQSRDSAVLRREMAQTQSHVAHLELSFGRIVNAVDDFAQAVELLDELILGSPTADNLRLERAYQLIGQGYALTKLDRGSAAEDSFLRAQRDLLDMQSRNPNGMEAKEALARVRHSLGYLYVKSRNLNEASDCYQKSLALRNLLVKHDPEDAALKSNLAQLQNDIALLNLLQERHADALRANRIALAIRQELLKSEPANQQFKSDVAASHNHIADVHRDVGDWKAAVDEYVKAVVPQRQLVEEFPDVLEYQNRLANSYQNLGNTYRRLAWPASTLRAFLEALRLYESLAKSDGTTPEYHWSVAQTLRMLAIASFDAKKYQDTIKYAERAVETFQQFSQDLPDKAADARSRTARCHYWRGMALEGLQRDEEALAAFQRAVQIQNTVLRHSDSVSNRRWLETFLAKQSDLSSPP